MNYVDLEEAKRRQSASAIVSLKPASVCRSFGTVLMDDIQLDAEPEWLVHDVLPQRALSVIWGDPGSGKSFMALDMALAVARGDPWQGKPCQQGGVAYVAAESGKGVKKRLLAYKNRNNPPAGLPFALIPTAVDLCTEDHETCALIAEFENITKALGQILRLVVIDTLSRVMAGGNENDSQDMGALIRNVDLIREKTGAHVLLVHHGGKDRDKKTRGHSSLFGALDTAIEVVTNETIRTATIRKQKDGEDGLTFTFKLDVVEVAIVEQGPITSCVVTPVEVDASQQNEANGGRRKVSGVNAIALDALRKAIGDTGTPQPGNPRVPSGVPAVSTDLWRRYFYQLKASDSQEAKKKAFQRAATDLQASGQIGTWGDISWVIQ